MKEMTRINPGKVTNQTVNTRNIVNLGNIVEHGAKVGDTNKKLKSMIYVCSTNIY